jgi:hypothetical protein
LLNHTDEDKRILYVAIADLLVARLVPGSNQDPEPWVSSLSNTYEDKWTAAPPNYDSHQYKNREKVIGVR